MVAASQPVASPTTPLEWALTYASHGLHVLPVWWIHDGQCTCPKGANCDQGHGKHPLGALVPKGLKQATIDTATITSWWTRFSLANIGLALEPSGLIAFDVDKPEGWETWKRLESEYPELRDTARQRSGSGNLHALFKRPPFKIRGEYEGITLRGANYIVAAPSTHKSGGIYEWPSTPWEREPITLPPDLSEKLRRGPALDDELKRALTEHAYGEDEGKGFEHQTKADTRGLGADRVERARKYLASMPSSIQGQNGSTAMFEACCRAIHGFALDLADARTLIAEYNERAVPPWKGAELEHKIESAHACPNPEIWRIEDRPLSLASGETSADGEEDFVRGERGNILDTAENIRIALRKLGARFSYNAFSDQELVAGLDDYGPHLGDREATALRIRIEDRYRFRIKKERFWDVALTEAYRVSFHPIRDYLDGLTWDGQPRLDTWLIDLAGAPDTPYVRAVSRLVLVAAVRRVRKPGAKFDEMVIFESAEGKNKSTALKLLAVREEWFLDDLPLHGDSKITIEQTGGKWIIEAGELSGMSNSDHKKLKQWMSRTTDKARKAYDRRPVEVPRQFAVIGTTNETVYLKDKTGNRRYWPVRIESFNLDALRAVRDQLWAEASHYEARGDSIRLAPSLYGAATSEQEEREITDPIEYAIADALGDRRGKLRALDVWKILNIEPSRASQDQNTRMGTAMRRLGWEGKQRRFDGKVMNAYVRGTEDERLANIDVIVETTNGDRRARVVGGVTDELEEGDDGGVF